MTTNQQTLVKLMEEHGLKAEHIAVKLDVSAYTVRAWMNGKRNMPKQMLELLQYKLQEDLK